MCPWSGRVEKVQKAVEIINPVIKVIWVVLIAEVSRLRRLTGQSIGTMDLIGNMAELKMESKNRDDPAVNTGGQSCIGVI